MRIIINCIDERAIAEAYQLIVEQMASNWKKRYNNPGWGWSFNKGPFLFFVRGIKNGLSITQVK